MRIRKHKKSYIVELVDRSVWRIWPADISRTLQWRPTTDLDVIEIDHEVCSHALVDRSNGSLVRVTDAKADWPVDTVRQLLGTAETSSGLATKRMTIDGLNSAYVANGGVEPHGPID